MSFRHSMLEVLDTPFQSFWIKCLSKDKKKDNTMHTGERVFGEGALFVFVSIVTLKKKKKDNTRN